LLYVIHFLWIFCFKYEKCSNFCNKTKTLFSSKIKVKKVILSQSVENGQRLAIFFLFKSETAFTLKSIPDSNQVKHCQTEKKISRVHTQDATLAGCHTHSHNATRVQTWQGARARSTWVKPAASRAHMHDQGATGTHTLLFMLLWFLPV
jgi:hypothetical protein